MYAKREVEERAENHVLWVYYERTERRGNAKNEERKMLTHVEGRSRQRAARVFQFARVAAGLTSYSMPANKLYFFFLAPAVSSFDRGPVMAARGRDEQR